MKTAAFTRWAAQVVQLSKQQREQLLALIQPSIDLDRVCTVIDGRLACRPVARIAARRAAIATGAIAACSAIAAASAARRSPG